MATSRGRYKVVRLYIIICFSCVTFNIFVTFFLGRKVEQQLLYLPSPAVDIQSKTNREDRNLITGHPNHPRRHHTPPRDGPCLQRQCLLDEGQALARAFPFRPLKSDWLNTATAASQHNKPDQRHRRSSINDNINGGRNQNFLLNSFPDATSASNYKHYGLLYAKVPKTGSSTAAGVALRIAKRYKIPVLCEHSIPLENEFNNRHPTKSFLWASIRDPTERAISYLSYTESRTNRIITNNNQNAEEEENEQYIIHLLQGMDKSGEIIKSEGRGGTQLYYTSLHPIPQGSAWRSNFPTYVSNSQRVIDNVRKVINSYDFFIVTDRMDESLVVMALLLDIDIADVLVFSSKLSSAGQYLPVRNSDIRHHDHDRHPINDNYDGRSRRSSMICVPLQKLNIQNKPAVLEYLDSNEWKAMNYGDFVLHAAASASLNLTIEEVIGRTRFDVAFQQYNQFMKAIIDACPPDEQVLWPCSNTGQVQLEKASKNCYRGDSGCGYQCIDDWLNANGGAETSVAK